MEISNLITSDNNIAVNTILIIAKQDIAIKNAIDALNELSHTNKIEYEFYGKKYGINDDIMNLVRELNVKLSKSKLGKY